MANCKIDEIAPHTIKKIELVTKYVESWAQILLNNPSCNNLVFIDCMSNCGEYKEKYNEDRIIKGTPYHVAKYFYDIAPKYPSKQLIVILNDLDEDKTIHLIHMLEKDGIVKTNNFRCIIKNQDADALLKEISSKLLNYSNSHFLLFYDPYQASINWDVLAPFFDCWGELIINHMVSDTIRGISVAKSNTAINKYQITYGKPIQYLKSSKLNIDDFEKLFEENAENFKNAKDNYYHSCIPFFNQSNGIVYNLEHYTKHFAGFKLFKKSVWGIFNGHSTGKYSKSMDEQLVLDFNNEGLIHEVDEKCLNIDNMVDFLISKYKAKGEISLNELWNTLDCHPIFVSTSKKKIKSQLGKRGCLVKQSSIVFPKETI